MVNKELQTNFIELLNEHQNLIHKICRIYTNNMTDHDDLFQEISIQLWKSFPQYRGESKFTTWAYRVALNTAISLHRKTQNNVSTIDADLSFIYVSQDDYDYETEEHLKLMYQAIHTFSNVDKALVFMYLEDKSYMEIAETLGISEINVRVKINRIKTKLKKILNP